MRGNAPSLPMEPSTRVVPVVLSKMRAMPELVSDPSMVKLSAVNVLSKRALAIGRPSSVTE
nr:hypothetical protein [Mesorhizobium sediminum]